MDLSNPKTFDVSALPEGDRADIHYAAPGVLVLTRSGVFRKQSDGTVLHYPQPSIPQSVSPANG